MEPEEIKKIRQQMLNENRSRTGAGKERIKITQEEWNAIQAGAISTDKLDKILKNSDLDTIKGLALPKHTPKLTSAKLRRAQSMLASGYTQADVADALGVGLTTLKVGLNE
jgi:DNA invertase Pin-like site-specific DNA recombinase